MLFVASDHTKLCFCSFWTLTEAVKGAKLKPLKQVYEQILSLGWLFTRMQILAFNLVLFVFRQGPTHLEQLQALTEIIVWQQASK